MIELLIWLVTLFARMESDIDGRECFEDEAVVLVFQTWTGTHHEVANNTGTLACVPVDDMRTINN